MTCTRLGASGPLRARSAVAGPVPVRRGRGVGARGGAEAFAQEASMEADRERAVAQQDVVEVTERERAPQAGLLVGAELEQEDLAQQVRQLVSRRVRVAPDLRPGIRGLEAGLGDQEA